MDVMQRGCPDRRALRNYTEWGRGKRILPALIQVVVRLNQVDDSTRLSVEGDAVQTNGVAQWQECIVGQRFHTLQCRAGKE